MVERVAKVDSDKVGGYCLVEGTGGCGEGFRHMEQGPIVALVGKKRGVARESGLIPLDKDGDGTEAATGKSDLLFT